MSRFVRMLSFGVLLFGVLLGGLTACDQQEPPMLLDVTGLSPRSLEAGDTVEISGAGFPEGKSASVTFEGSLFRAGLPALTGFRSTFAARVDGPERLSFVVGPEMEEALSQGDRSGAHATFRGRALVAFAPKIIGAPPVQGQLKDLTLEIYSSAASSTSAAGADGSVQKLLALLNMNVEQTNQELRVSAVQAGRAERAGLILGDTVMNANGVSVFSAADLLPAPQERQLTLFVRHSGGGAPSKVQLSVDGFSAQLPSSFSWVFAIALAAGMWLFVVSWKAPFWQASGAADLPPRGKLRSIASLAVLVGIVLAAIELRPPVPGLRALAILIAVAMIALLRPLLGFLSLGFGGRAGFKLRAATVAALKIQLTEVVSLLPLAPLALKSGGLGLDEVRALQGSAPWHWAAFSSFSGACGALLFLWPTLFDVSGVQGGSVLTLGERPHRAASVAFWCDGLLITVKCVLFATLFLALSVPPPRIAASGAVAALLPVCLDVAKYALVVLLVFRLRERLHHPRVEDLARPLVVGFLMTAALTTLLLVPTPWQQIPLLGWIDQGVAPALCLAGAMGVLLALWGKRWKATEPPRNIAINPWL